MYQNGGRVGQISWESPGFWSITCGGYEGAHVEGTRRRLTVSTALDDVLGSAHVQRAGRWRIVGSSLGGAEVDGLAIRKANTFRWNVWLDGRKVGYTIGPDGPAAAAALLFVCGDSGLPSINASPPAPTPPAPRCGGSANVYSHGKRVGRMVPNCDRTPVPVWSIYRGTIRLGRASATLPDDFWLVYEEGPQGDKQVGEVIRGESGRWNIYLLDGRQVGHVVRSRDRWDVYVGSGKVGYVAAPRGGSVSERAAFGGSAGVAAYLLLVQNRG
jgi:hypothetical protein